MSGEQRVTDEVLAPHLAEAIRWQQQGGTLFFRDDIVIDLAAERTAHRATEAKLREALAEVADYGKKVDALVEQHRLMGSLLDEMRAEKAAAESALAATKAKLEAAEKALLEIYRFPTMKAVDIRAAFARLQQIARAALTTKETTDAK